MCGLAALVGAEDLPAEAIVRMATLASHRGPDDEGYALFSGGELQSRVLGGDATPSLCYESTTAYGPRRDLQAEGGARVLLGHRRLSILDLSPTGHQPMSTPDRRLWIVYNGELYNYLELRAVLQAQGHSFSTTGDTEVILAAYQQWGAQCLEQFNGMFSFVLLDRGVQRVFCARDRFGIKPLYYWTPRDGVVAFASEIKQFSALPEWQPAVNGARAHDFLAWGVLDHTDETLFRNVYQLRGGEAVLLELAQVARCARGARLPVSRWYDLRPAPFEGDSRDAAHRFGELFENAVDMQLRADVAVGSCLSGGLDSSAIVCVANRLLRRGTAADVQQRAYSAISEVARFDESVHMHEVVRATGIAHRETTPDFERLFDELPALTWHNDEPFGSTSIYAQWSVFRLAAQDGIKVMLDGQGADEMLAGYHGFFRPLFAGLLRRLRWLALAREISAARAVHGYSALWAIKLLADGLAPTPLRMLLRRAGAKAHDAPGWIDRKALGAQASGSWMFREAPGSLLEESRLQLLCTSLPMLLHWEDRDSMAHSVESRVPFLDHRLVEFVLGLPDDFKLHRGTTKCVLRAAMEGVLPDTIRVRQDKIGFATAEEVWFRERQPERMRGRVRQAIEESRGILTPSAMDVFDDILEGRRAFDFAPWRMISFGQWMSRFGVRAAPVGR